MPSSPLLAVNNNVSLISIHVAPSSWLASVIIVLVFLALYIPRLSLRIPRAFAMAVDLLDGLDASLQDFEPPVSPTSMRHSSALPSEPATEDLEESDIGSGGGYSPPAWRNLGNGDRSRGFWKPQPERFHRALSPDSDDDYQSDDDVVLEQAIRTRLPQGSLSPDKGRSPSPPPPEDTTLKVDHKSPSRELPLADLRASPQPPDNYIRFAVRAEVLQRTRPIENAITFLQKQYNAIFASWGTILTTFFIAVFSISTAKMLSKPAAPRPVGDLVKIAGLARSFEPLIYFSEPAVAHVKELQSTSIAIWDLGESVRISGMADADTIVQNLDAISETMKKLVLDLTRFHTHVDGDIDAILDVMDWAKMHLNRLNTRPPPSHLSHAYDNIHNLLTDAQILEDATGAPTRVGRVTTAVFGMSNPQREQRMIQRLFTAFISTIEEAIQDELEHSVSLFALFDDIDDHFLKLARHVAHESSTQEEFHAELLSGLWARMLGPRAAELRKFERNKALLHDVRHKTVRNKGNLVSHHGKLLTLKASLESLRGKLASQLVRGLNSSTLTLEDQIRGIAGVRDYLSDIRRQQKSKVMETLYSIDRTKKYSVTPEIEMGSSGL
ncbi:hypothetical protein VFPBJ_06801 [Purpureocillium lilacinum]|nr:hypothetical protein VFPBJ_06801 [Purpureocillium lilacinum]